ncbi:CheY-like superfamily [Gongronella butleri]|nr:CheY-like superfamily [Gongronella butleri]
MTADPSCVDIESNNGLMVMFSNKAKSNSATDLSSMSTDGGRLFQRRRSSLQVHYQYQRRPSARFIALRPIDTSMAASAATANALHEINATTPITTTSPTTFYASMLPTLHTLPPTPLHYTPPSPTITYARRRSSNATHASSFAASAPPNDATINTTLAPLPDETTETLSSSLSSSSSTTNSSSPASTSPSLAQKSPTLPLSPSFKRQFHYPVRSANLRVLVADDNEINLQILAKTLKMHMSDTFQFIDLVPNGQRAIDQLRKHTYDLILMDIDMPRLNGIEATSWIRRGHLHHLLATANNAANADNAGNDDEINSNNSAKTHTKKKVDNDKPAQAPVLIQNRRVPIVAVTTNMTMDWKKRYLQAGMNGCLSKPVSPFILKHSLTQVLLYGSYWDYSPL